ncbi:MAG TPA: winged helix-turn-helix transcriptional regulator [Bdellovibrionales bacterium]|nr:winged helix-turn-helix transcriptional regulator [Bdellovibrionales bacterium]
MNKISAKSMIEDIVGCKWSLSVLEMVKDGINRPGQMARAKKGLTAKVLNERLRKLVRYKIIEKVEHGEGPPRVEYFFTEFGKKFHRVIDEINRLDQDLIRGTRPRPASRPSDS